MDIFNVTLIMVIHSHMIFAFILFFFSDQLSYSFCFIEVVVFMSKLKYTGNMYSFYGLNPHVCDQAERPAHVRYLGA